MKGIPIRIDKDYTIVVVPFEQEFYGWMCVIIHSTHERYPVGGYNIFVTHRELEGGQPLDPKDMLVGL